MSGNKRSIVPALISLHSGQLIMASALNKRLDTSKMNGKQLEAEVDKIKKELGLTLVDIIKKVYEVDKKNGFELEAYYDVDVYTFDRWE